MAFVPSFTSTFTRPQSPSINVRSVPPSTTTLPSRRTPQMLVVDVGSTDELDKIVQAADDSLIVIDYSTTWCGPCKVIAPIYEQLSEKFDDVIFLKVIGDATPASSELMKREGIRAVPAFHFWKLSKCVEQFSGARAGEIESTINKLK